MVRTYASYLQGRWRNGLKMLALMIVSFCLIVSALALVLPRIWDTQINISSILTTFMPEGALGPALPKERINVIILGRGGHENDAPDLTDAIQFVSYDNSVDPRDARATIISIPRDLYVQTDFI